MIMTARPMVLTAGTTPPPAYRLVGGCWPLAHTARREVLEVADPVEQKGPHAGDKNEYQSLHNCWYAPLKQQMIEFEDHDVNVATYQLQ